MARTVEEIETDVKRLVVEQAKYKAMLLAIEQLPPDQKQAFSRKTLAAIEARLFQIKLELRKAKWGLVYLSRGKGR